MIRPLIFYIIIDIGESAPSARAADAGRYPVELRPRNAHRNRAARIHGDGRISAFRPELHPLAISRTVAAVNANHRRNAPAVSSFGYGVACQKLCGLTLVRKAFQPDISSRHRSALRNDAQLVALRRKSLARPGLRSAVKLFSIPFRCRRQCIGRAYAQSDP